MMGVKIPGKIGRPIRATRGSLWGSIWSMGTTLCSDIKILLAGSGYKLLTISQKKRKIARKD
jgi:hypothetical protein